MWENIASECNQEDNDDSKKVESPDLEASKKITSFIKEEKETFNKLEGYNQHAQWLKLNFRINKQKRKFLVYEVFKYAAIVILVFATGYLFSEYINNSDLKKTEYTRIEIPNTERGKVYLADGTEVNLNSGSKLSYSNNIKNSREVHLQGEALFKVKSDKKNPFLVHLDDISIKVTGTTFNIHSYGGKTTETTLLEGEIAVLDKKGKVLMNLKPDQQVSFNHESKKIELKKIEAKKYASWQFGKIHIKNKTLEELSIYMEKLYNARILFVSEEIKNIRVTGTMLTNKPLEQIFEVLQFAEPLNFKLTENEELKNIEISYSKSNN